MVRFNTMTCRSAEMKISLLCGTLMVMVPMQARAGDADAQPAGPSGIGDIVVTAQKRTESAQKVPISIQSFDSGRLAQLGVSKLQDIEAAAPSLSFGDGSEQGRTGIRGVIDYSRNAGYDSRVGLYVDGVYFSRSWMTNQTLLGIAQVDVLRGPQGTLFGKNTDAGAISISTIQPGDKPGGEFEAEYGSYDRWKIAGRVNLPLGKDVALQIAATHLQEKGYYDNDLLGTRNQGINSDAVRAQLLVKPTDWLKMTLVGDYVNDDNSTLHYTYVPTAGSDPYHFRSYFDDSAKREMGGVSMTAEAQLGGGYDMTSITAWRSGSQSIIFNNESGATPFLTANLAPRTDQVSQELRIASPKWDHGDFVAGLYYFHGLNKDNNISYYGAGMTLLGPVYGAYANQQTSLHTSVGTDSYAGFINGNLRINDMVELFAGGRVTYEKKTLNDITNNDPVGIFSLPLTGYRDGFSNSFFTPKGGVNLHLARNVLLFGTVGRGFKSGGWNVEGTSAALMAAGIKFRPETVTSYEVGLKSDFLNRHARLNITGFYQKFKDFQVFTFVQTTVAGRTTTATSLTNAGAVSSRGVEVEAMVIPFEGLTLSTNYTYNVSKFDSYPGGGGTYNGAVLNADGVQTPYAPRHKAYIAADYARTLGGSGLKLGAHFGYSTQSSENFDPKVINPGFTSGYSIAGYDLADARLTLGRQDGQWSIAIWSKNLLDAQYIRFANRTAILGNNVLLYGQPRTIGATLHYKY